MTPAFKAVFDIALESVSVGAPGLSDLIRRGIARNIALKVQQETKPMSVHDAEPGDIYADSRGKLWRVAGTCHEPTVIMREIERPDHVCGAPFQQLSGGVSGVMWKDWKRIFRAGLKTRSMVAEDQTSGAK